MYQCFSPHRNQVTINLLLTWSRSVLNYSY